MAPHTARRDRAWRAGCGAGLPGCVTAGRALRSAVRQTPGADLGSLPSARTGGIPVRSPGQHWARCPGWPL